ISGREIVRRGLQLNTEFRYLDPKFMGEAHAEAIPSDNLFHGKDRWGLFAKHQQSLLPGGWAGAFNVNRVSDDTYLTDLKTRVVDTSQVLLPNDALIARSGVWSGGKGTYGFSAFAQHWQTLQADPLVPVTPPYNRVPQLTLVAVRPDIYNTDFDLQSQFVAFDHPTLVTGS